jgi:copper chaperone CopZ
VGIHCDGCVKEIKRILPKIEGNEEKFKKCKFLYSFVTFPYVQPLYFVLPSVLFSRYVCVRARACVYSFLCSMLSFLSSSKQLDNHFTVQFFRKGFAIFLTFSLSICSWTCNLKVDIHCEGCLKKVKRVLHKINGNKEIFYKCKFIYSLVIFPFV